MELVLDRLTAEQQMVVDFGNGWARLTGDAGTGKSTTLAARVLALAEPTLRPGVLLVVRRRSGVRRLHDAVLPRLVGRGAGVAVTTWHGVAFRLVRDRLPDLRLLTGAEQWSVVHELLSAEGPAEWPALHPFLGRPAFVDEVAGAVLALQSSMLRAEQLGERASAAGAAVRWQELGAFLERYRRVLDRRQALDASGLLQRACELLDDAPVDVRYSHILADDYEAATPVVDAFLRRLAAGAESVTVAGNADGPHSVDPLAHRRHLEMLDHPGPLALDVRLTRSFRRDGPGEVVVCAHPALEAEVVAGELLAAHDDGVAWADMAVLVRRPAKWAPALARALARHNIPAQTAAPAVADHPAVRGIVAMLRWVAGEHDALAQVLASPVFPIDRVELRRLRHEAAQLDISLDEHPALRQLTSLRDELRARRPTDNAAALAFSIWERRLAHLVGSADDTETFGSHQRSLDAVVAFLDGLTAHADRNPDDTLHATLLAISGPAPPVQPSRVAAAADDGVTIASMEQAAGNEWHTVVMAGCVEGELPRLRSAPPFFDPAVLDSQPLPSAGERLRHLLDEENRLFHATCRRATHRLVATAAPEPGVLTSRLVGGWDRRQRGLPAAPGPVPVYPAPSAAPPAPPTDAPSLVLSASQLDTYDDCPLRYAYRYVVGVRDDTTVHAELGTVVHEAMAAFLDPGGNRPRTWETLQQVAEEHWRPDIARYRPQVEEARRQYFDMLERWWEVDGARGADVVAVERRFEIEVGRHTVVGSIDRIDRTAEGGLRIIDYKTGKRAPSENDMPDNVQLGVYHLAAVRDPELSALGPPTHLELLFLREMKVRAMPITAESLARTERRVAEVAERILGHEFDPSVDANCRICPFHRLCPLQPEGRHVA